MASTYSTNLAIELIGTGDQAGTWGNTTNTNLGTLIEQAISGYVTQAVSTGTDTTITIPNGATGVARNMYIELTGTGGTNTNLIVPSNKKLYFIFNNASGAVTVKVSGQTGVSVPAGKKVVLASNGTDTVNALNYIADFGSNSATITQLTATSATITNLTLTSLVISNLSIASANVTVLTSASATITNLLATSLTVSSGSTLNGGVVINEPGADVDFRVEGDTDANLFFADASTDRIGIGISTPSEKVHIFGSSTATSPRILVQSHDTANATAGITFYGRNASNENKVSEIATSGSDLIFKTNNTQAMTLDASGNLGIGTTSPGALLHVYTGTQESVRFARNSTNSSAYVTFYANNSSSAQVQYAGILGDVASSTAGSHNGNLLFYTTGSGTSAERARITSGGLLQVTADGTNTTFTSGGQIALKRSNSDPYISWHQDDGTRIGFLQVRAGGASSLALEVNQPLTFWTNSTERARITAAGELCINATATEGPARVTTVSGTSGTACYSARNSAGAGSTFFSFINNNDTALIGTITNNGNTATAYNTTSDARLKENIAPADDAGSVVDAIQIVKHDWKVGGHVRYGVIAQDLHEIAPEAVAVGDSDDVDELKRPWGVDYSKLVPMLVKEIQSLRARVAQLESK